MHVIEAAKNVIQRDTNPPLGYTLSAFTAVFLDSCSNELWFRTAVNLLQHKGMDPKILEKLSIVLQRLSKIK